MRDYFADDLLLIMPTTHSPGVRLSGEVVSTHRGPLALALTDQTQTQTDDRDRAQTDEILIDLTGVRYLANSGLETLVAFAVHLQPPQCLVVRSAPDLDLHDRIAARGWDRIETLRLEEELGA
ncbi:hypothetical protein DEJ49_04310 [Streptomyces venezuelae]|uniref:STAS domain-containing protein n=1 Tax=Streptomyces venezuelae TaxID=54571 RepID=A0A5P2CDE1_STRVZ|nr:hypothetical protein [Streptomyces venezuelae]QES40307.1 hypothetical protein DEJ49_04310 [Streptomyces venezuelae]